eukprot:gb/GECG01013640.1/.p1 GENE.gb/GECG01013640.1/~~gb/GECG01013640.1/.p1  ORF type:complete len:248 (+),score=26.72 gb/GECG01013640.1/:1-744(+)
MSQDPHTIANTVFETLKNSLSSGTSDILNLYTDQSLHSVDGENGQGPQQITGQFQKRLGGGAINLRATSIDVSYNNELGVLLAVFTGEQTQGSNTSRFQQLVTLAPSGSSVNIVNDITRIGESNAINNPMGHNAVQDFIQQYFNALGSNPQQVAAAYREHSQMHLEGSQAKGQDIAASLQEKFTGSQFQLKSLDIHPLRDNVSVALVTGALLLPGQENPLYFTRAFILQHDGSSLYIANDVFRLNYG